MPEAEHAQEKFCEGRNKTKPTSLSLALCLKHRKHREVSVTVEGENFKHERLTQCRDCAINYYDRIHGK